MRCSGWEAVVACGLFYLHAVSARSFRGQSNRTKRQTADYQTPYWNPLPGSSASNLAPRFPFATTYNGGLAVDPGTGTGTEGFLNVPVPTWGLFDLAGGFENYVEPFNVGVGVLAAPTNPLGISPRAAVAAAQNPALSDARASSPTRPVAVLPGGFVPLSCKPPFCNPFEHSLGLGVEVDDSDTGFRGGLDFPIPLADNGVGTRFPLSGGISSETESVKVQWGHHAGPVNPFAGDEAATRTIVERVREPAAPTDRRSSGIVARRRRTRKRTLTRPPAIRKLNGGRRSLGVSGEAVSKSAGRRLVDRLKAKQRASSGVVKRH